MTDDDLVFQKSNGVRACCALKILASSGAVRAEQQIVGHLLDQRTQSFITHFTLSQANSSCLHFWDELSFEDEEFTLNPLSEIGYQAGELSLEVKVFYLLNSFMNWEDKWFLKVVTFYYYLKARLILWVRGEGFVWIPDRRNQLYSHPPTANKK